MTGCAVRRIREFARPVHATAVPELTEHLDSSVRIGALVSLVSIPLAFGPSLVMGAWAGRGPALVALCACAYAAIAWLAHARPRWVRPDALMFLLGMNGALCVAAWEVDVPVAERLYPHVLPMIPLAFAALAPWRPRCTGLLALATSAVAVLVTRPEHALLSRHSVPLVVATMTLGFVGAVANQMTRRLYLELSQAQRGLRASDHMAQLGRMTAGFAHELKTPTATTAAAIEQAGTLVAELEQSIDHPEVSSDDLREIVAELRAALDLGAAGITRAARFVANIREHTRAASGAVTLTFSVAERMGYVDRLFGVRAREAGVTLRFECPDHIVVRGDPGKLDQILVNLVENAVNAISESGLGSGVTVTARTVDHQVVVEVCDDGPGIPEALHERVFEPMYTTRGDSNGTGLGLAIARELAALAFHGDIALESRPGHGATFRLSLRSVGTAHVAPRPYKPSFALTDHGVARSPALGASAAPGGP